MKITDILRSLGNKVGDKFLTFVVYDNGTCLIENGDDEILEIEGFECSFKNFVKFDEWARKTFLKFDNKTFVEF